NRAAAFLITAQAKGLPNYLITWRHLLRISLLPAITVAALQAGILFSGTVITESIFSRPGLGQLLLSAVLERDYPIVQGVVLLIALLYITINAVARWLIVFIDPRLSIL
ncbi:MAG: ABC transporter permease, partial [Anaerolineae bacterium]|nr:ABC transporter permease [Anaerolineae bacterium]